jgi:AraC family L-rhamnose operon regulatory protein RhaS
MLSSCRSVFLDRQILYTKILMPPPIPIYRSHDESYVADNCLPLVEAVGRGKVQLHALIHGHYPGCKLPAGELPGMKTAGYWDAQRPQTWGLPWHRNEGVEVTFLESGRLSFGADGREYTLQPDALTVTRPWQSHRVGSPMVGPSRLHWLILDVGVRRPNQVWRWPEWVMLGAPDREELAAILRQTDQPVWKASGEIRHCFRAVASAVESDRKGSNVSALTIRINELLLLLLTLFRKHNPPLDEALTSTARTVELFLDDLRQHSEHLALEWTVSDMASSCGLGVSQFVQVVKRLTNMTPLEFLNDRRLEFAAKLLREHPLTSISNVAQACGFSTSQYFATTFGRKHACSPTEFRAKQK